jgi:hypothetical protein
LTVAEPARWPGQPVAFIAAARAIVLHRTGYRETPWAW